MSTSLFRSAQPGLQIPRDAFTAGAVELSRFPPMDPAKWDQLMEERAIKGVKLAVARIHRLDRVERWAVQRSAQPGLFWYKRRPLWDIGVLTLMLGGLASSTIGFYLGIRRLRRSAKQTAKSLTGAPTYARARSAGL